MKEYIGLTGSKGIAIGKILVRPHDSRVGIKEEASDTEAELRILKHARTAANQELRQLADEAEKENVREKAAIWKVHQMMLSDQDYWDCIVNAVSREKLTAVSGIRKASDLFAGLLQKSSSEIIRERAADVKDVSLRLISCACQKGADSSEPCAAEPSILLVDELRPSDVMTAGKNKILGFVASKGSVTEHACILARAAGIPAVVGAGEAILKVQSGASAILDGDGGRLLISPEETVRAQYEERIQKRKAEQKFLKELKTKQSVTQDGKEIKVFCNIGSLEEARLALENGAEGIGLFRSEFLFLNQPEPPAEEEQYGIYRGVAELFGEKKVIVRTLDIGSDKQTPYIDLGKEENPALGSRGIRYFLQEPELLKIQLRALCRASAHGNLAIMFPMITSEDEVKELRRMFQEINDGLRAEGIPTAEHIELGIMIETPAAALVSDQLAEVSDFFSIGTNDLTQYTLAVDRTNETVSALYSTKHPAVMRLIGLTVENAKKQGIHVGICGESASDPCLTAIFAAMGVSELSVTPGEALSIKNTVRSLTGEIQEKALEEALQKSR